MLPEGTCRGRKMARQRAEDTTSAGGQRREGPQHACVSARTKVSIRVHIVNSQLSADDTNIARGRAVAWGVMFETEKRERKKTGMWKKKKIESERKQ